MNRRPAVRYIRALLGFVIIVMSVRSLMNHWVEMPLNPIIWQFQLEPLAECFAAVLFSYGAFSLSLLLIALGWRERIDLVGAAGLWARANLMAFLPPGKATPRVIALAESYGISRLTAAGAMGIPPLVSYATGASLGVGLITMGRFLTMNLIATTCYAVAGVLFMLPLFLMGSTWTWHLGVQMGRPESVKPAEPEALGGAMFATLVAWLGMGLALTLLAEGTLSGVNLSWKLAAGSFAIADVAGAMFLFLPAGLGVREGVLFVLLKSGIGVGPAIVVALLSRVVLTICDIGTALPFILSRSKRA